MLVRRADEILNTGDEVVSFRDLLGLPFPCVGVGGWVGELEVDSLSEDLKGGAWVVAMVTGNNNR